MPYKNSDKTPGEKLLALYTLLMLQGERAISLASLAEALDCSKQTVLRLLNQLEASGYGKLQEPERRGKEFYYKLVSKKDDVLNVGAKELAQLALCRNLLIHLLPSKFSFPGLQKQSEEQTHTPEVTTILYKGYTDYTPFENQYRLLLRAIQKHLVCKIVYRKSIFSTPREIYFAPMRLVTYHETISVIGWEVSAYGKVKSLYENWLWLYLQRCVNVKLTGRSSDSLEEIEFQQSNDAGFGIMNFGEFKVKLLFNSKTAEYIRERYWSGNQKITLTEDKNLILEMTVRSEPEIIAWILSFGPNVKVLEPDWLSEEVLKSAREIIENSLIDKGE